MKKIYTFFMVYAIALTTNAQLVFNENFSGFTTGFLGTQGGWVQNDVGPDVRVAIDSQLFYGGYTSGTQYIRVTDENGTDPHKLFSTPIPTNAARFIFISFVVRVDSASQQPNLDDFSISLRNTTVPADVAARFYIAEQQGPGTEIQFGIAAGDENPDYTDLDLNLSYDTTYLIVIRYDVVPGDNNDNAYLWVNPSLGSEPGVDTADASQISSSGEETYGSQFNALLVTQLGEESPVADFDAFRVSHGATSLEAWTNLSPQGAPLPVRLTSFNASRDGLNNIKLVWNTAEENGVMRYVVEKSADGRDFTAIASLPATNQKTYTFTDMQPASDYTYYRIKMVDIDGSYKLSYIISLKSKLSLNILVSPNPVINRLLIQYPKVIIESRLQILNSNGQLIKDFRLPANSVMTTIDLHGLANGLYYVIYKNGTDVFTKMVLKQ
jgi:hypothetical protein